MPETHALAIRPEPALPSPADWQTMLEMARLLVPTGLLPSTIKTPEQAVAIILKGRELRVPAMHALSNIVVVQGKPACSAELMLALIYRDHGDEAVIVEESTPSACRLTYKRPAWRERRSFQFTLEDARTAGLAGKGTWAQYPQAMLRARAVSAVARLAFPDSIGGMHSPEELGAEVRVTDDGAVEVANVRAASEPPLAMPAPQAPPPAAIASPSGESPRMRFAPSSEPIPTTLEPEMIAGDALESAPEVPADDIDSLTGEGLADACDRLRRRLAAANVPYPGYPNPRTNRSLREWWWSAAALLEPAANVRASPAPQAV